MGGEGKEAPAVECRHIAKNCLLANRSIVHQSKPLIHWSNNKMRNLLRFFMRKYSNSPETGVKGCYLHVHVGGLPMIRM